MDGKIRENRSEEPLSKAQCVLFVVDCQKGKAQGKEKENSCFRFPLHTLGFAESFFALESFEESQKHSTLESLERSLAEPARRGSRER